MPTVSQDQLPASAEKNSTRVENIMIDKVITALTPLNKNGELDARYDLHIQKIVELTGDEALEGLAKFQDDITVLERNATQYALRLSSAFLTHVAYMQRHESWNGDEWIGWKAKAIRKHLAIGLQNLGFKEKNAKKIVRASEFLLHSKNSGHHAWLNSLKTSHLDVLSRMSDDGYKQVVDEVKDPTFDLCAGGWSDISVRRLEEIQRKHPKLEQKSEKNGRSSKGLDVHVSADDSTSEILEIRNWDELDQYELADELASIALVAYERLPKEAFKDIALIEMLKPASKALFAHAHLAALPGIPITV